MGVGFNIPHPLASSPKPYTAPVGEYKPEVRLGLFNLPRLKQSLPWPNNLQEARLVDSWYQALHRAMKQKEWKCLRGGDPRTVYIHPLNTAKRIPGFFDNVRRCVETGWVPDAQHGKWDLVEEPGKWVPPLVRHVMVIAIFPVDCDSVILARCVRSVAGQGDADFDVVVIDDATVPVAVAEIVNLFNLLGIRPEIISDLRILKKSYDNLFNVLILRADEALMSSFAIAQLKILAGESNASHGSCLCNSTTLRCSKRFGLATMYEGAVAEQVCMAPRCFSVSSKVDMLHDVVSQNPSCSVIDAFAEVPVFGSNRRMPVVAGFIVWSNRRIR
jgi:hypothetical protein